MVWCIGTTLFLPLPMAITYSGSKALLYVLSSNKEKVGKWWVELVNLDDSTVHLQTQ
jgi:hypothetical protein